MLPVAHAAARVRIRLSYLMVKAGRGAKTAIVALTRKIHGTF